MHIYSEDSIEYCEKEEKKLAFNLLELSFPINLTSIDWEECKMSLHFHFSIYKRKYGFLNNKERKNERKKKKKKKIEEPHHIYTYTYSKALTGLRNLYWVVVYVAV